ncbi:MAG TPA: MFS transporter [Candidatus Limnocylindrales bacterium]|nr:MFS transporter [Candidatus Limnocylindrales bacterium]
MTRDVRLLFGARTVRLFGYGALAVVLALYLAELGFDEGRIGLLLGLTLAGDAVVSLWLTTRADRFGRRRTLRVGAGLMIAAAIVFALSGDFVVLLAVAIVGVLSPSGNEVGPFLSVEQAALSQVVPGARRTTVFAWYQLAGSLATAAGSLAAGVAVQLLQAGGTTALDSYRAVIVAYAVVGIALLVLVGRTSSAVEAAAPADPSIRRRLGLHRSGRVVGELSALFALDAFGGGFVVQSIVALWFHLRWGVEPAVLGGIFFGANALAGLSGLVAARLAARYGLIATMVGTHLPSNVLLILVPLMPSLPLAVGVLLARFAISQMDVPTRQSYTMAVVHPDERSAAAGLTGMARSAGAALAPLFAVPLLAVPVLGGGLPFVVAGGLKIVYDLALWQRFRALRAPDEERAAAR